MTQQQCSSAQYFNQTLQKCQACNSNCLTCANSTTCLTCPSDQMYIGNSGLCQFCAFNYTLVNGTCQQCNCSSEQVCFEGNVCIKCSNSLQYQNLEDFSCSNTCPSDTQPVFSTFNYYLNFGNYLYCRGKTNDQYVNKIGSTMYVDPDSKSTMELGTLEYPFKTISHGLLEIYNNLQVNKEYTILVKENTTTNVQLLNYYLQIYNATVTINTYSKVGTSAVQSSNIATLYFKGSEYFWFATSTRFISSTMFMFFRTIPRLLEQDEGRNLQFLFFWVPQPEDSVFYVQYGTLILKNLYIKGKSNCIKESIGDSNTDGLHLIQTLDVQSQNITFQNIEINIYGRILYAATQLNLHVLNSKINIDNLKAGFIVDTNCLLSATYVTNGEINFSNNIFYGTRNTELVRPIIYLSTYNNITIDNNTFNSFLTSQNQISTMIYTKTPSSCLLNDRRIQKYAFTNNIIEPLEMTENLAFGIQNELQYDLNQRNLQMQIENITVINLKTLKSIFELITNAASVSIKNIYFSNITQPQDEISLISLQSWNTVAVQNLTYTNSITSGKLIFFFQSMYRLTFTDIYINNIQIIVRVKHIQSFKYEHYMQPMDSFSSYVQVPYAIQLTVSGTTFNNITYSDTKKDLAFIIKLGEQQIVQNQTSVLSYINNVSLTNSEVFLFYYGGFKNYSALYDSHLHLFQLSELSISNNEFNADEAIFYIDSFLSYDNIQIQIIDSTFTSNIFNKGQFLISYQNQLHPIQIINCEFIDNSGGRFITSPKNKVVNLKQKLQVINSRFYNTSSLDSSLFTIQTNSELYITDTTFDSCISPNARGGIIIADYTSVNVYIDNSLFQNNYGQIGSVFMAHYDSYIQIANSIFLNNTAVEGGIGAVEKGGYINITNSTLYENKAIKSSLVSITNSLDVISSISNCTIYDNQVVDDVAEGDIHAYLEAYLNKYSDSIYNFGKMCTIQVRLANLIMSNNIIYRQERLLDIYQSTVKVSDSTFSDIEFDELDESYIMLIKSNVELSNLYFTEMFYEEEDEYHSQYVISNDNHTEEESEHHMRALQIEQQSTAYIADSLFENLRLHEGGGAAVKCVNSNLTITRSNFTNNQAVEGGALALYCSKSQYCKYTLEYDYFDGNFAEDQGGAIYTNKYPPQIIGGNSTFSKTNEAEYGDNIASIPYGVRVVAYNKNDFVVSGNSFNIQLQVEIIDYNGKRIVNDQTSGTKQKIVENVVAYFENLTLTAYPGSQNVMAKVYAQTINNEYISQIYSVDKTTINSENVYLNFRRCIQGEIEFVQTCSVCDSGSYSLLENSANCNDCLLNANCNGGYELNVNPGYWRSNFYSTSIISCFNAESCVGGLIPLPINSSEENLNPLCADGYGGNLCDQCVTTKNGVKQSRIASHQCGTCPALWISILKVSGIFTAVIVALSILIFFNLKTFQNVDATIALRIITNYFQIMTTTGAFNLEWPEQMQQLLGVFSTVGDSVESFTSIDCLLAMGDFNLNEHDFYYIKSAFMSFLPVILAVIYGILLTIITLPRKQKLKKLKKQMIITVIVILYSLHPSISKYLLGLYNCLQLEPNEYWLIEDLQIRCWSQEHLKSSLIIGLPGIALWIIGLPVLYLIYLKKNSERLYEKKFFKRFKMIYSGMKPQYFYWEFINILRKTLLVGINVFLQMYPNIFKALLCLLILSFGLQLQKRNRPYSNEVFNLLENREYMTSAVTFFAGLLFVNSKEISSSIQLVAFIVIVLFNLNFILLFFYCILRIYDNKHLNKLSIYIRNVLLFDKEVLHFETKKDTHKKIEDLYHKTQQDIVLFSGGSSANPLFKNSMKSTSNDINQKIQKYPTIEVTKLSSKNPYIEQLKNMASLNNVFAGDNNKTKSIKISKENKLRSKSKSQRRPKPGKHSNSVTLDDLKEKFQFVSPFRRTNNDRNTQDLCKPTSDINMPSMIKAKFISGNKLFKGEDCAQGSTTKVTAACNNLFISTGQNRQSQKPFWQNDNSLLEIQTSNQDRQQHHDISASINQGSILEDILSITNE